MNTKIILGISKPIVLDISSAYIIGVLIAILLLGYLIYALIKPEKF